MRIVFAGTPAAATPSLEALHHSRHDVCAVVTRNDAPQGRKRVLTPSPVAQTAAELGIPLIKANRLDDDVTARVAALDADLGVIVAYGGLVRAPLLATPAHGWINLHFSALPTWRGAAPVQRALINGDTTIDTTVFQLTEGLDEGDIWRSSSTRIAPDETAGELLTRLARSGADDLVAAVDGIEDGTLTPRAQAGTPTYASKLALADGALDLSEPLSAVYNRFRGVTPEPGAHVLVDGERFKIHAAEQGDDHIPRLPPGSFDMVDGRVLLGTGSSPLVLTRVQPSGKPAMNAADWWRGQQGRPLAAQVGESA
ncbi:methionyl-tRNA formyltransferase [Paramicrobacterium agarici]|uniref:Methionyl-tRNA formyltransferase n=1 Tax=Paramicrobacterium agarici TaxID=630514 RepID=A0A2A9DYW7_9MICO|nr:methionyl-tRNA formyltransferase [Microbacterium agarici]PFG31325.1 methionyl-tRNA formyltransferase [Microbacterium agarici]